MPEKHTLGPEMTLRMNCHLCKRRRLCRSTGAYAWHCAPCAARYAADQAECKWPEAPCTCSCCWDVDPESQADADNQAAVLREMDV